MHCHRNVARGLDRPTARERFIHCTDGHNLPPRPGLGYMLFAIAEAFLYAYLTERALIVDWRDTEYLNDGRTNLFAEIFECEQFLGVPIQTGHIDDAILGKSRFVVDKRFYERFIASWEDRKDEEWVSFWDDIRRLRSGAAHGSSGEDRQLPGYTSFPLKFIEDEVISTPFVGAVLAYSSAPGTVPERFLRQLKLRKDYQEVVERFRRTYFQGKCVVGLHVRHGNGEKGDFSEKRRQIADLGRLLEHFEHKVTGALKAPLTELAVFLCTDSDVVVTEAGRRIPNLITRPQWRPQADTGCSLQLGHLCPGGAIENAANAAIDMFLLGSCDYLAQVGNGSWFSKVAARLVGHDKVVLVDAPPPDIDNHVFACGDMPAAVTCRAAGRASVGKAGYLVYGPYVRIERDGRYSAELTYQTMSCLGSAAGAFEAVVSRRDESGAHEDFTVLGRVNLPGTDNRISAARVDFDTRGVEGMLLELRVYVENDVVMNAFHIRMRRLPAVDWQPIRARIGYPVWKATSQVWSSVCRRPGSEY
jgi:nodulation protein Z